MEKARQLLTTKLSVHARTLFPGVSLHCAIGGFHLAGATEPIIPATVEAMNPFDLKVIAAGHCTGWRGLPYLS